MSEKDQLKPCPFCGGKAIVRHSSLLRWCNEWAVECLVCSTIQGHEYKSTAEEAVSMWNTRS